MVGSTDVAQPDAACSHLCVAGLLLILILLFLVPACRGGGSGQDWLVHIEVKTK